MNRSMIVASNTMGQLQKQLDTISNNLSNLNTVGFKRRETNFNEMLYQQFSNQPNDSTGRLTPPGLRVGVGARIAHTSLNLSQGSIKNTDRELDFAFTAENQFLCVADEENGKMATRLTRNGALYVSPLPDGSGRTMLVNSDGHPVLNRSGNPIFLPHDPKNVSISPNGALTFETANGQRRSISLSIVQVHRPQVLQSIGDNMYGLPDLAQLKLTQNDVYTAVNPRDISIQPKALETSNVDEADEMTEMMMMQRHYQFNAKAISISDQMLGLVNGIR